MDELMMDHWKYLEFGWARFPNPINCESSFMVGSRSRLEVATDSIDSLLVYIFNVSFQQLFHYGISLAHLCWQLAPNLEFWTNSII